MKQYIVPVITAIITMLAALTAFYQQSQSQREAMMAKEALYEYEGRRRELETRVEEVLKQSVAALPPKATDAAVEVKLGELRSMVEAVDQKTLGLRQALNPIKPDEILTIARLTDEIQQIKVYFEELKAALTAQQSGFQESILRETKSSSDASRWLFVVLIPLLVNFFYTVWKDLRSERREKLSRVEKAADDPKSVTNSAKAPQQGAQADGPASGGSAA